MLKERCLKWFLSQKCPFCGFFDKNSPNSASFYPIFTIDIYGTRAFFSKGLGGSDQYLGSHFNLKTLWKERFSFSSFSTKNPSFCENENESHFRPKPTRVFFLLNRNAIPVGVCLSNRISFFLNLCHRHFDRFKIRRFDFDRFKIRRFDFRPLQNSAIWFP